MICMSCAHSHESTDSFISSLPDCFLPGLWPTSRVILHFPEISLYAYLRLPCSLQSEQVKFISYISPHGNISPHHFPAGSPQGQPMVQLQFIFLVFTNILSWPIHESGLSFFILHQLAFRNFHEAIGASSGRSTTPIVTDIMGLWAMCSCNLLRPSGPAWAKF